MFKTLENETSYYKEGNKKSYSPGNSHRLKSERYSTFFANSRNEEGVY
jgi:hypothetical protein